MNKMHGSSENDVVQSRDQHLGHKRPIYDMLDRNVTGAKLSLIRQFYTDQGDIRTILLATRHDPPYSILNRENCYIVYHHGWFAMEPIFSTWEDARSYQLSQHHDIDMEKFGIIVQPFNDPSDV